MVPILGLSAAYERRREQFAGDKWWAHQDLNLGPKDYEQLKEIKPFKNQ